MGGHLPSVERLDGPVPVTILTGFLGSGKTTLLNHILSSDHGLKVGVIVNEFGAIGIDDKLITRRTDDLVELSNGCVCCTMAGDLIKALVRLGQSGGGVEYILVETTGLADPAPIAVRLSQGDLRSWLRLDGIVTVVDAYNFDANLERAEAAYAQLVSGDILLINKIDLVGPEVPGLIENGVRKINPHARFMRASHATVDPFLLLDVGMFRLKKELVHRHVEGGAHHSHAHPHHGGHEDELAGFEAATFASDAPFDADRFRRFMDAIPPAIFRAKGILHLAGHDRRHVLHLVGDRCTVEDGNEWLPDEARRTDLVFIGRQLDRATLSQKLDQCVSGVG